MRKFLERVRAKYQLDIDDYPGLYKWSVENVADFWREVWHFCGIKASRPYGEVRRASSLTSPLRQSAAVSLAYLRSPARQPRAAQPRSEIWHGTQCAPFGVAWFLEAMAFPRPREPRAR